MKTLAFRINTYFATLIVTVVGAGAALLIVHLANSGAVFANQGELGQANAYLHDPSSN